MILLIAWFLYLLNFRTEKKFLEFLSSTVINGSSALIKARQG